MKKYVFLIIAVVAVLIFFYSRSGDDTSEIAHVLDQMVEAGKQGMQGDLIEHVSIEYRDDYGGSYLVVKNVVENLFDKYKKFDTKYKNLSVSIDNPENGDKTAVANLDIHIVGYTSDVPIDLLGTEDSYQNITLYFKKTKILGWKVTRAEGFDNFNDYNM